MNEDWESVLQRLEKGNMVRDKLASFDMRGPAKVQQKSSGSSVEVKKIKIYRRIEEHDYSSLAIPIGLIFLGMALLILMALLFSRSSVASVETEGVRIDSPNGNAGVGAVPPTQSIYVNSPSTEDAYSQSSDTASGDTAGVILPFKSEDTSFFQCTAKKLLYPTGTGECR